MQNIKITIIELEQKINMHKIATQNKTNFQIFTQQIDKLFNLAYAVQKLYKKSLFEKHKQNMDIQQQYPNLQNRQQLKQKIIDTMKNKNINTIPKFYERVTLKDKYNNFINSLTTNLEIILTKPEHNYYSSRKLQVQSIRNIVQALQLIKNKIRQYIAYLNSNQKFQLLNLIQQISKVSKKIIFQRNTKQKQSNYQLHFNFPSKQSPKNKTKQASEEYFKQSRPHTANKSYALTHTTRPSTTTKQIRQVKKIISNQRNQKIGNISIYQNLVFYDLDKSEQKNNKPKMLSNRTGRVKKYQNIKNTVQQIDLSQSNLLEHQKCINSQEVLQEIDLSNKNNRNVRNQKNSRISQNYGIQQKYKQIQDKLQNKIKKRHRNGINNLNILKQLSPTLRKTNDKSPQTQNRKSSTVSLRKRNNKSNQDLIIAFPEKKLEKSFKKYKSNLKYKKKGLKNKNKNYQKNSRAILNKQNQQNIIYEQQQIPKILLIKHIQEKHNEKQKVIFLQKAKELYEKQKKQRQNASNLGLNDDQIIKRRQQQFNISNNQQKLLEKTQLNKASKVQLTQINQLRSEFVKARQQNRILCSEKEQHSSFFIQQGYLSQRYNLKFQTFLKSKLNIGGQIGKQEINLQNQIQQRRNEKINELERFYTFISEDQWIKKRKIISPSGEGRQFKQFGLQIMPQYIM